MREQSQEKTDLCKRVEKVCGRMPDGLGDILYVLTHPDVIDWTEEYINSVYFDMREEVQGTLELIHGR